VKIDPTRSTPAGYWRFASEYFQAANAVESSYPRRIFFPTLQLYGQSIELALKAFLLKRGASHEDIYNLRHNLSGILGQARKRRLGMEVKLSNNDVALIRLLSKSYSDQSFRYIVTGVTQIPLPSSIAPICEHLVEGLEQYCTGHSQQAHSKHR
jgi:HEPN domain-containing protein